MRTRQLRTSTLSSREELSDALQGVFVAELLAPSTPLWLVTPWISDVALIDNRTGSFTGLLPDAPIRTIRLSELLVQQMIRGGLVVIACRPEPRNRQFIDQLSSSANESRVAGGLASHYAAELHEKGILADHLFISGSMNLTYNGLRRLEESILITDDPDAISRARHAYQDRWSTS